MKKSFARAALKVCLLGSAAALVLAGPVSPVYAAAAPAVAGPRVSAPVGKFLDGAKKLMDAGDVTTALSLIKQAQALPDQTPIDTFEINNFLGQVSYKLNDHVTAETAFAAMAESPAMPDGDKTAVLRIASVLATEQKHFDNGIKYALEFIALGGPPDSVVLSSLSVAYFYKNDYANAEATAQKAIAATPAGQAPNHGAMEVLFNSQVKQKKQDAAIATLEQTVTYYDDPGEWGQYIDASLGTKGLKAIDALFLYRLRLATKAAGHSDDYTVAAALALSLAYPVEAQAFLEAGLAAGVISNSGKTGAQIGEARSRAAKDRATLTSFDATARKAASGELDVKLAETYYGYGRYGDAEEAARRALTKGGAAMNANEANMVQGQALAMQGKNTDAIAAFNNLKNPSPGMAQAQHVWLVYAGRKWAPPAAAPAH